MISVLVCCPCPWDSTSFYRAVGPFSRLGVRFSIATERISWNDLLPHDVVFLQRPFDAEHLAIAKMAKTLNLPLWIDHDDNVFDIPFTNPHRFQFKEETIKEIFSLADVLTVSTEPLREVFEAKGFKSRVIQNAWDYQIWPRRRPLNEKKVMLWRGSDMHWQDLDAVVGMVERFERRHPGWRWVFMGAEPAFKKYLKNYFHYKFTDVVSYFDTLKTVNPSAMFIPLEDTVFNRCKSNVAWMEGFMAGARHFVKPRWYKTPSFPLPLELENLKRLEVLKSLLPHQKASLVLFSSNK